MKSFVLLFTILMLNLSFAQVNFNDFFSDQTMRIDYHHTGDSEFELVTLDKIYKYPVWAGSLNNLIDEFNNGAYYYKIYDLESGKLIFSKGFDSYFKEYQTSSAALDGVKKTYEESALIPYPKYKIKFSVEKRDKQNNLNEIFSLEIDPDDLYILNEERNKEDYEIYKPHVSGDHHSKLDVVIIAEGYTEDEEDKFEDDLKKFTEAFFIPEPFKSNSDKVNVFGVFIPSAESGIDIPGAGVYVNSALDATFYSLGSERYILTENNTAMIDAASSIPFDAIYIMVNHERYGGGGIYNAFSTFTSGNQFSEYVFLHEFGHSFAGLADEYYTSEITYNEFYPKGVEPVEPNITRLLDKENVKWEEHLTQGIEIPTPWEKAEYDSFDTEWQKIRRELNNEIAELKLNNAPEEKVNSLQKKYNELDRIHSEEVDEFLTNSKYFGKVGAFEGAGYSSKGMYRSMLDCLMFTKGIKPYCKACEQRVKEVLNYYSD